MEQFISKGVNVAGLVGARGEGTSGADVSSKAGIEGGSCLEKWDEVRIGGKRVVLGV